MADDPTDLLLGLRASSAELLAGVDAELWSDADVGAPSLLPGWTRGHVLAHLAQNADSIARTLAGALRDEVVPRYPDGWEARGAAIEAAAHHPFTVLAGELRDATARLDRVLAAVHDADAWSRPTDRGHQAAHWVWRRWVEVEVHRVDLAGAHRPGGWPPLFVSTLLPMVAATLVERSGGPLSVVVSADGSNAPDTAGASWSVPGSGTPVEVRGPDWAVTAWAIGRAAVPEVGAALTATPPLTAWD